MSNDINVFTATGRLGNDPELKYFPNGDAFLNLSVAIGRSWKDKTSGERKKSATWAAVVLTGKLAENIAQFAKKGRRCAFTGEMKTRKYTGNDQVERTVTEFVATRFEFMDFVEDEQSARPSAGSPTGRPTATPPNRAGTDRGRAAPAPSDYGGFDDDDIPFR